MTVKPSDITYYDKTDPNWFNKWQIAQAEEKFKEKSAKDIQINGDHYKDMAIQPSEFIVKNNLNWYEGNAVKYICRHKAKGGKVDLEKAIHYLQLAIEEYYG